MPRRLPASIAVAGMVAGAALSCGSPPPSLPPARALPVARAEPAAAGSGARYLVPGGFRIERTEEGVDRAVVDGRRVELRGVELQRLDHLDPGADEPELQGGALAPRWAGEGPSRYVFWKGRELYGAGTFGGALHRIATLPAEPQGSFDWLSGTGLLLPGGAVLVPVQGGRPAPLGLPAVLRAVAADAQRAFALDGLGGAWLTIDGGRSFRDARAELGTIQKIEVRGDEIVIGLGDGQERFVGAGGAIRSTRAAPREPGGGRRDEELDAWPLGGAVGALEAAVRTGLPLADGGLVIAARGFVGRFDPRGLHTTSVAPISALAGQAECFAFRARDADLLVCADQERATVIDLGGVPRVERTFDLTGAPERDRFLGADGEALGYLGPCEGRVARSPADEAISGGEPMNPSPSRSGVFCVRKARDEWVEHRVQPADEGDVVTWIPRPGGGAAAIVARPGSFLAESERISVRGGLRVVRVARSEPPLAFQGYSQRSATVLDRSLVLHADDTIEGFVSGSSPTEAVLALSIDARGRVQAHPGPPRAGNVVTAGRFALARSEDGRLFETVDFGHRWIEVPPPPGGLQLGPSSCSPAGCAIGSFVRLGWTGSAAAAPPVDAREAPRERAQGPRPVPPSALRLACRAGGPAEGKRSAEPFGFGYTPKATPRGMVTVRVGAVGAATYPWSNGALAAAQGDLDLGWVAPLDLGGTVQRRSFSLARAGLTPSSPRLREMRLGYLLEPDGGLGLLAIGYRDTCPSALLELAGLVRPLGGCAEDRSVGVDLGGRVFVLRSAYDALITSLADPPTALHELHRTPLPSGLRALGLGAGARDGKPVALVLDVNGEALLAPIDGDTGALGVGERLPPLASASLGNQPSCAGGQRPGEARIVLPFEGLIGLDRASLRGLLSTGGAGVAVLRWSRERVCLDAVEIPVRDERFEPDLNPYEGSGNVRKLIARFVAPSGARDRAKPARSRDQGGGSAALVLIGLGFELRQKLECTSLLPGELSAQ